ncbi:dTDP-4-dehydrorhamnose 3,5-epimerase family protein [Paracoccus benzoatiresistens]|uniref:dTDP-4-dehydrorhamnose 3,5-epimerase n=1 Tax=Paracoccus benzoatiresistens TaxID=2997341 RepID=A0ABT4J1U6_9RHOB|nr:dTDP-4-dehydrorhamnose 3,5-epimerase family protein [Paracoccus sp. EF6]MCZ0960620.1 dTDP-4-dehydrorhamnose 3,5-epimerase family protein [Paracoccus sp. EF6]
MTDLPVDGARLVSPPSFADQRGTFSRLFCRASMQEAGLPVEIAQVNQSASPAPFTLRGLHWQAAPHAEAKLVTCVAGAIHDVIADVRPGSPSFGTWCAVTLTAGGNEVLYVPAGCAHGFLTLKPDTQVVYTTSAPHVPALQHVLRWNDPGFAIEWPAVPLVMSATDRDAPDWVGRVTARAAAISACPAHPEPP